MDFFKLFAYFLPLACKDCSEFLKEIKCTNSLMAWINRKMNNDYKHVNLYIITNTFIFHVLFLDYVLQYIKFKKK